MFFGKQISKIFQSTITAAEIAAAPVGSLGAFLKTVPTGVQKALILTAIAASTDGVKASNVSYGDASSPTGRMGVSVNGDTAPEIGDAVKTKAFYWSADAGATAKALTAVVATDLLYVNTSILGYPLEVTDSIKVTYSA